MEILRNMRVMHIKNWGAFDDNVNDRNCSKLR
jgi:hypothetical protein